MDTWKRGQKISDVDNKYFNTKISALTQKNLKKFNKCTNQNCYYCKQFKLRLKCICIQKTTVSSITTNDTRSSSS